MKYTKEFIEDIIDKWDTKTNSLTLREWFHFMNDEEYTKYIIRGEYENEKSRN